jgi:excisionase family DNA binding protein
MTAPPAAAVKNDPDAMVNVREAAALVRLSEVSIRRYLTQKKLRRYKIGGRTLVRKSEVLGLIKEA